MLYCPGSPYWVEFHDGKYSVTAVSRKKNTDEARNKLEIFLDNIAYCESSF